MALSRYYAVVPKKSNKSRKEQGATRYTATEIRKLLASQGGECDWRTLVDLSQASSPREITQLRQMLKGLERSGEIFKDASGVYRLPGEYETSEAVVESKGTQLYVQDLVIARGRLPIRAGDKVEYSVAGTEANVVQVLEHSSTPVIGILRWQGRYPYVEGMGAYRGRVELDEPPALGDDGDTVAVRVLGFARRGLRGLVVDVLESTSVLDQAITTAVASFNIPDEWPHEVEVAKTKLPKSVQPSRFKEREDLTALPLVTIDGETAKDFDDAVYAEKRRGGWRLVVAIADVAHYVKPGSAIDVEAVNRGTSVYFPERVIPMLPEELSNELCSLKPEVPRLALVCDMEVSKKGNVVGHQFYEAVIYSHARLTYTEVEAFLDGAKPKWSDAVLKSVDTLHQVYLALRSARENRGALDFPTHEGAIEFQDGRVSGIGPVRRLVANQVIEEAMIAANVSAAQFLESVEVPSLYRVHEPPDPMKLEELTQMLAYAGVRLKAGDVAPKDLQQALLTLPKGANKWLFGQLALRTMQQAVYTPENKGHYGLALERYMHFTSPIRRYPDLLVHRAIKSRVGSKRSRIPGLDELHYLGGTTSQYERRAESAGWMVEGWLKCDYLRDRVGDVLPGIIAAVTDFGLFVELDGYFVQGLVHVSSLGSDYFQYHPRSMSLVGERSGRKFVMGDQVRVIIKEVEPSQGKIDLAIEGVSARRAGARNPRSRNISGNSSGGKAGGKKGRRRR